MSELQRIERLVVGCAVFVAAATAMALTWDLTPWSLGRPAWVVLFTLALGAALVVTGPPRAAIVAPRPGAVALFAVALALCAGAFIVARDAARGSQRAEAFTQLWARSEPGSSGVLASVRNVGGSERSFRLAVRRAGRVLHLSPWFPVAAGATRSASLPADGNPVEVVLYRSDAPQVPHRSLTLRPEAR